ETIQATKVVVANAKLYANKSEGFVGMDLKKDENAELVGDCSDIDDIIVFLKNGNYIVTKVTGKAFIGKDIIHVAVFNKNDERTTYNVAYRDGKYSVDGNTGTTYVKRFAVTSVTRDKWYNLTKGTPNSVITWFSANSNAEAEILKVFLKPKAKLKKLIFEFNFASIAIKGRASMGNILSKNPIHKIQLKSKGFSTIGGKPIWFDTDINRLNEDERGIYLGEFHINDKILAVFKDGTFYTSNFDLSNRYQGEILRIEKLNTETTFSAIYLDGETKTYYIKRFSFEQCDNVPTPFISDIPGSKFIDLSTDEYPQVQLKFTGKHAKREDEIINVEEFIGKKSYKAKGKRATTYEVGEISFIEPLYKESVPDENTSGEPSSQEEKNQEGYAPGDTVTFDNPTLF
ncbi:MAG: DNA gyrase/topoisomerase IV subunit A, partial [Bacteroidia bacterium]|nr:DNA gyrase/topoisomerase IV subunit A [Bacteroidia bacterium]